ncbi:hypothetical protein ACFLSS_04125 [Bacteroidota bacterium]
MKRRHFSAMIGIVIMLSLTGCGPDFNTDFDPPPPEGKLEDIFPANIGTMPAKIARAKLKPPMIGFSAAYGDNNIVINSILLPDKAAADEYFKLAIVPNIDKMKNHFRGKINGRWRASGTDENGRKWFGWVNNNWVFLINASDKKYFKMAIDAFKYVEE